MGAQAEAEARERHWQGEVQGLQSKVEKLEGLLQREMGHHQLNSPTPRPLYDLSPAGAGWHILLHARCMDPLSPHFLFLARLGHELHTTSDLVLVAVPTLGVRRLRIRYGT